MNNFTPEQIADLNRRIAVEIEESKYNYTAFVVVVIGLTSSNRVKLGPTSKKKANQEMDRLNLNSGVTAYEIESIKLVPSYHSDHAALHRVVEKIVDNDTDKLIGLCIGTFACVKTTQYDDMGQEIKSYDTEDFSSKGRIMKAMYSAVAQYLEQIGGKGE